MKKYLGAISSFVVGVLSFVFLTLAGLTATITLGSNVKSSSTTGWDLLQVKEPLNQIEGYSLFKVATIIMLVLAGLLILFSIFLVLCNTNVIKTKINFNWLNEILLIALMITALLSLMGGVTLAKNWINISIAPGAQAVNKVGVGIILNFVVSLLAMVAGGFSLFYNPKKSGRKSKKRK